MTKPIELETAEEIADRLHLTPGTIKDWSRHGIIPAVRLSPKVIRFEYQAVIKALLSRQVEGGKRDG